MYTFLNYLLFDIEIFCYNIASSLFFAFLFLMEIYSFKFQSFFKLNERFLIRRCLIIQYAFSVSQFIWNFLSSLCTHQTLHAYNKILLVVLISLRHILWYFVYTINIKINWIELVIALSEKNALEKNFCSKDNEQVLILSLLHSR